MNEELIQEENSSTMVNAIEHFLVERGLVEKSVLESSSRRKGFYRATVVTISRFIPLIATFGMAFDSQWMKLVGSGGLTTNIALDIIDGEIARTANAETRIGRILDHTTDLAMFFQQAAILVWTLSRENQYAGPSEIVRSNIFKEGSMIIAGSVGILLIGIQLYRFLPDNIKSNLKKFNSVIKATSSAAGYMALTGLLGLNLYDATGGDWRKIAALSAPVILGLSSKRIKSRRNENGKNTKS